MCFINLQGILNAVEKWAPRAEHRNCARHIYANWKKNFHDKSFQKHFWKCAKAPCRMLFNLARARLAQLTQAGAQAILNTHPQHWSRAWFKVGSDCDSVDNNMCESFNKWILEARFSPIISMLEKIRRKVMTRISDQINKSARWNTLICPGILKKLNVYINESAFCHAISNGSEKFEVKHHDNRFIVSLEKKECSCRYWQLSGQPCPHAISCIFSKTNGLDSYIAECYSVDSFKKIYEHCLQPVEGMNSWPEDEREPLSAPGYIKMPGRPKRERRRELHEPAKATKASKVSTVMRCTKCKQVGHNRSTCDRHNTGCSSNSAPQPNIIAGHNLVVSSPPGSCVQNRKRKAPTSTTTSANLSKTSMTTSTRVSHPMYFELF